MTGRDLLAPLRRRLSTRTGLALVYHRIARTRQDSGHLAPAMDPDVFRGQLEHLRSSYGIVRALSCAMRWRKRGVEIVRRLPSPSTTTFPRMSTRLRRSCEAQDCQRRSFFVAHLSAGRRGVGGTTSRPWSRATAGLPERACPTTSCSTRFGEGHPARSIPWQSRSNSFRAGVGTRSPLSCERAPEPLSGPSTRRGFAPSAGTGLRSGSTRGATTSCPRSTTPSLPRR